MPTHDFAEISEKRYEVKINLERPPPSVKGADFMFLVQSYPISESTAGADVFKNLTFNIEHFCSLLTVLVVTELFKCSNTP